MSNPAAYDQHGYPTSPRDYKVSSYQSHAAAAPAPLGHNYTFPYSPAKQIPPSLPSGDLPEDGIAPLHSPTGSIRAPSFTSSHSSSYAGSAADEISDENEVDLITLLTERLSGAFDPMQLDRSTAIQAQTSGMLNSKNRELMALQEEAAARLAQTKRSFLEGMKTAREVKSDLEYMHKRVKNLQKKTQQKYPVEYQMARDRIPPPPT